MAIKKFFSTCLIALFLLTASSSMVLAYDNSDDDRAIQSSEDSQTASSSFLGHVTGYADKKLNDMYDSGRKAIVGSDSSDSNNNNYDSDKKAVAK